MNGARGSQVTIILEDDGKLDDKIKTDQWRSSVSESIGAISIRRRVSWSSASLSPSSSSSSPSTRSSTPSSRSIVSTFPPLDEIPPFSWERMAVSLGRGRSAEEIKKASIETCRRLLANFNILSKRVREERLVSMSQSQKNLVPPPSQDVSLSMEKNLGTQSSANSDQAMGRFRWKTQDLAVWRIKQRKTYPTRRASSSDSDN